MTIVATVSGPTTSSPIDAFSGAGGVSVMSPDALMAYCQMQLGSLDGEMTTQMNAQELALHQRTAVEGVQTTLESFGTNGPQNYGDLKKCSAAFDAAIAKLPPGDPVAAQLAKEQADMNTTYGSPPLLLGTIPLVPTDSMTLVNAPKDDQWKGTTGKANNLIDGIKSDAEIQMLKLQDLVSQRQQAVEQATGMMTKEDQTLNDEAKSIGQ